jgi:glutathione S-transferase
MSALTLFYSPGACSLAVHIALREAGADFTAHRVVLANGEQFKPEFLAVNPKARVPALRRADEVLTEGVAIMDWIVRTWPSAPLLPDDPWLRARAMETLVWLNGTMHGEMFASIFRPGRFVADPALQPALKDTGLDKLRKAFSELDQRLAGRDWLVGERFSLPDAYLFVLYRWGKRVQLPMATDYPNVRALAQRVLARPAVMAALAEEGLTAVDYD